MSNWSLDNAYRLGYDPSSGQGWDDFLRGQGINEWDLIIDNAFANPGAFPVQNGNLRWGGSYQPTSASQLGEQLARDPRNAQTILAPTPTTIANATQRSMDQPGLRSGAGGGGLLGPIAPAAAAAAPAAAAAAPAAAAAAPAAVAAGAAGAAAGGMNLASLAYPAAVVAGGLLSGAGSLIATKTQSDATKESAQITSDATKSAAQLQKDQYDQTRNDYAPWRDAGEEALQKLKTFDQDYGAFNFQQDSGYTFRLNEGLKAIQNSAAARGMGLSGNTLKAFNNYAQDSASQEYQNAFNRYQTQRGQRLNNLQSLAGVGQTAVQQVNSAGQNYANQAGNAAIAGANARAQGINDSASANASGWMGGTNALNNALAGGMNAYSNQQILNSLLKR